MYHVISHKAILFDTEAEAEAAAVAARLAARRTIIHPTVWGCYIDAADPAAEQDCYLLKMWEVGDPEDENVSA